MSQGLDDESECFGREEIKAELKREIDAFALHEVKVPVILLEGKEGMGKSTILNWITQWIVEKHSQIEVFQDHCTPTSSKVSYLGLKACLRK